MVHVALAQADAVLPAVGDHSSSISSLLDPSVGPLVGGTYDSPRGVLPALPGVVPPTKVVAYSKVVCSGLVCCANGNVCRFATTAFALVSWCPTSSSFPRVVSFASPRTVPCHEDFGFFVRKCKAWVVSWIEGLVDVVGGKSTNGSRLWLVSERW